MSLEKALASVGKNIDRCFYYIYRYSRRLFIKTTATKRRNKTTTPVGLVTPYMILVFDSLMAFLALLISIQLRIGGDFFDYSPLYIAKNILVFSLVSASVFLWLQTHQSYWKYTSIEDILPIFLSVVLSNILFFPLMVLMNQDDFLPYSVLIINVFVLTALILAPRFLACMFHARRSSLGTRFDEVLNRQVAIELPKVLIVGNINSVEIFLREIVGDKNTNLQFDPIGILSLDPNDTGRSIRGVSILGYIGELATVCTNLKKEGINPSQVLITEKSLPEFAKKHLVRYVQDHGIILMHVIHQYSFSAVA